MKKLTIQKGVKFKRKYKGFWEDEAARMSIGDTIPKLSLYQSVALWKAMRKIGFIGQREMLKDGKTYRMKRRA